MHRVLTLRRWATSVTEVVALVVGLLVIGDTAHADDMPSLPAGTFTVGTSLTEGIDERSGEFTIQLPLISLVGYHADDVDVAVSYRQADAVQRIDESGLGFGWSWNIPRIEMSDGVHFVSASGERYSVDESSPSGLVGNPERTTRFRSSFGTLASTGEQTAVDYAYVLEHQGGTDYFGSTGDLVSREDIFGNRTLWHWAGDHRLATITNEIGVRLSFAWTPTGVDMTLPARSDGATARAVLTVHDGYLRDVTAADAETTNMTYDDRGRINSVLASQGALTTVTYQNVATTPGSPTTASAVRRLHVSDQRTGETLILREWTQIGEHNHEGYPTYSDSQALAESADGHYRYTTVLSDGRTHIENEYNALGLLVTRSVNSTTSRGRATVLEQEFVYPAPVGGGVFARRHAVPHYAKPTTLRVTHSDDAGNHRTVTEKLEFDDRGRLVRREYPNGAVTVTEYNSEPRIGSSISADLVLRTITTGADGKTSLIINTPDPARRSIQKTERWEGDHIENLTRLSCEETTRSETGFVTEERVTGTSGDSTDTTAANAGTVTTRYEKVFDRPGSVVRIDQITTVSSSQEPETTSTRLDLVSGQILEQVDPMGRVASTNYDHAGRVTATTAFDGKKTRIHYAPNVTRVTDDAGIIRSEYTDAVGRVVAFTDNLGERDGQTVLTNGERTIEKRRYENDGSRTVVSDARGNETVTDVDVFGRPTRVSVANHNTTLTQYDDVTNSVTSGVVARLHDTLSSARTRTTEYRDDSNRRAVVTGAREDGIGVPEERIRYDGLGHARDVLASDLSISISQSGSDPLVTTAAPANPLYPGHITTVTRDRNEFGAIERKTVSQSGHDSQGPRRKVDGVGKTTRVSEVDGATTTMDYTPDGLLRKAHNTATGVTEYHDFDPLTRALTKTTTTSGDGASRETAFDYDPATGSLLSIYDPAQRDVTVISYTHDIYGNVTSITYPDGRTITHNVDQWGRQTHTKDILGNETSYEHDSLGLMKAVTQTNVRGELLARVEYEYDEYGRTTAVIRDNGLTTEYTFTSTDRVLSETTRGRDGTLVIDSVYHYDSHDNVIRRTDVTTDPTHADERTSTTTSYNYNAYDQLLSSSSVVGETANGTPVRQTDYVVDVAGNVTKETTSLIEDSVVSQTIREFELNASHQTTAVVTTSVVDDVVMNTHRAEQRYDSAGNLIEGAEGTRYTYNLNKQLVSETRPGGMTVATTYWADGKRKSVTEHPAGIENANGENSRTTHFYWDNTTLVNDVHHTDGSQVESDNVASYLLGAARHARTLGSDPDATRHYVADRHGNVRALTNTSSQVTTSYIYSDYGMASRMDYTPVPDENPFQYSGEYTDARGKQHLGKRVYDPRTHSFTTQDGANEFNLYRYTNANPITSVDPTGRTAQTDTILTGLVLGVTVVAGLFSLGTMTLPTMGVSWLEFGAAAAFLVTDIASTTVASVALARQLSRNEVQRDSTTEKLTWAATGLGFAAGPAMFLSARNSLAAARAVALSRRSDLNIPLDDLAEGVRFGNLDDIGGVKLLRERGQRVGGHTYFHGTEERSVDSIIRQPVVPKERLHGRVHGDGFYVTTSRELADSYSHNGAGVTMQISAPQRAVKLYLRNSALHRAQPERTDRVWAIQNPRFSHKPGWLGRHVPQEIDNSPTWNSRAAAVTDLTNSYGVQVVQFDQEKVTVVTEHGLTLITGTKRW